MKGFKEAIGIAVFLVFAYLILNFVVVITGFYQIAMDPGVISNWQNALLATTSGGTFSLSGILMILGLSLLVFPKLALGLSGFETGVAVMPLVDNPNRIEKTQKMLRTAASDNELLFDLQQLYHDRVNTRGGVSGRRKGTGPRPGFYRA